MTSSEIQTSVSDESLADGIVSLEPRTEVPRVSRNSSKSTRARDLAFAAGTMIAVSGFYSNRAADFSKFSLESVTKPEPTKTQILSDESPSTDTPVRQYKSLTALATENPKPTARVPIAKGSINKTIRAPYVAQIIASLTKVSPHAGQSGSAVHVERIFSVVQTLSEVSPFDPFTRLALAFYDSLAFENRWASCTSEQFDKAKGILKSAHQRVFLTDAGLNTALDQLESAGFATIPFAVSFDGIQ